MHADDRLERIAGGVSDGQAVDWAAATAEASPDEQHEVAALRDLARIADFNRQLQRTGADEPLTAGAPERWGGLLLLERAGTGASGEVWRAWDARLQREVALKFLQPRADGAPRTDAALLAEARAIARVRHPGVVAVYGIDEHDERAGMWMEYLRGETLAAAIEHARAMAPAEVARIGHAVADALAAVHAAALVHRDVKPANVLLEPGGRVVLTDFGLGRLASPELHGWRISGTPAFMPPALLDGGPPTPRTDIYALGVTLRWALTGHPPFAARSIETLREEARRGPAIALATERPDAPPALVAAIDRAMAADPAARFARAADFAAALEVAGLAPAAPVPAPAPAAPAPRRSRAWLLMPVLALAIVAVVWLARPRPHAAATVASPPVPAPTASAAPAAPAAYDVEAGLVRRNGGTFERLVDGDRVAPGDQLALEFRATRPAYVYVVDEDERGAAFLLFPQPRFERTNPLPANTAVVLPGTLNGRESAWTVTSRGGREHILVVASPDPVRDLEAELAKLPPASPDRPVAYAPLPGPVMDRLRGVGGVAAVPGTSAPHRNGALDRIAALAGRERNVTGIWVRRVTLDNPER
jgi:hypothetical protein